MSVFEGRWLYLIFLIIGLVACSPSNDEITPVIINELEDRGYTSSRIEITGREICSLRSGDEARNIRERWLIAFTEQNSGDKGVWMVFKQNEKWYLRTSDDIWGNLYCN